MQQPPPGWAPPPGYPPPGYPPQGYAPPPPPKGTSKLLIAILSIGGICAACVIFAAVSKKDGPEGPVLPMPPPAARQYITQSCAEVSHLFGMQSRTTELQQTELWRQYDGRWARWTVTAGEVSETLGQLQMQFKCGTESLLFDGHAMFPDAARARLLQVQQGSAVQIEGRLSDHGRLMGLSVSDAELR